MEEDFSATINNIAELRYKKDKWAWKYLSYFKNSADLPS